MYIFKGFDVNVSYPLSLQGVLGMDSIEGQSKSNIEDAKLIWIMCILSYYKYVKTGGSFQVVVKLLVRSLELLFVLMM